MTPPSLRTFTRSTGQSSGRSSGALFLCDVIGLLSDGSGPPVDEGDQSCHRLDLDGATVFLRLVFQFGQHYGWQFLDV